MPIQWIRTNLSNNVYKYHFLNSNQTRLSWREFLELLSNKDQDFFKCFKGALDDANIKSFPYRWNCSPVSQSGLGKSFEFVVTKESLLQNDNQNYSSYQNYIDRSPFPHAVSFSSYSNNLLIIPIPVSGKNFSSISYFTKNASLEQQENFWQKASIEFTKEINRNPRETRWLCTEGLAVPYLHVRIDKLTNNNAPSSLFFSDYQNPNYTPVPTPQTPKGKLLANLDKICLAPDGFLANNEHLKTDGAEEERRRLLRQDRVQWKNRYMKIVIEGEEIDLEDFFVTNNANDYIEVKRELIKKLEQEIRQNPSEWKIEQGKEGNPSSDDLNYLIKHQPTGQRHWKYGFLQYWGNDREDRKSWTKIENALKNSPNQKPETETKKWYNPLDYPLPWAITTVFSVILIVITMTFWKKTKKRF